MANKIELALWGAGGKMGRMIATLALESESFNLKAAIESDKSPHLGKQLGELLNRPGTGPQITAPDTDLSDVDLIVDFSSPEGLREALKAAEKYSKPLVSGTTGITPDLENELKKAAEKLPILYSPNMSFGVNAMFWLAREMAKILGSEFDIEIFEIHHRHKKDAPSGTALRLAREIADEMGRKLQNVAIFDRHELHRERTPEEIGIQAARGGDVPGEHTVFFFGQGERLELTHRAGTREIFARGALRAAQWLYNQKAGFYSMFDVLKQRLS